MIEELSTHVHVSSDVTRVTESGQKLSDDNLVSLL
jgi:hypothetical protein